MEKIINISAVTALFVCNIFLLIGSFTFVKCIFLYDDLVIKIFSFLIALLLLCVVIFFTCIFLYLIRK